MRKQYYQKEDFRSGLVLVIGFVTNLFNILLICKWSQVVQVYAVAAARYSLSMRAGGTA